MFRAGLELTTGEPPWAGPRAALVTRAAAAGVGENECSSEDHGPGGDQGGRSWLKLAGGLSEVLFVIRDGTGG